VNEPAALLAGVLRDLDGAGALADCCDECDARPARGRLLRRRAALWSRSRREAADVARLLAGEWGMSAEWEARCRVLLEERADEGFRRYLRARFGGSFTRGGN
jgi:hypothetical protein